MTTRNYASTIDRQRKFTESGKPAHPQHTAESPKGFSSDAVEAAQHFCYFLQEAGNPEQKLYEEVWKLSHTQNEDKTALVQDPDSIAGRYFTRLQHMLNGLSGLSQGQNLFANNEELHEVAGIGGLLNNIERLPSLSVESKDGINKMRAALNDAKMVDFCHEALGEGRG